MGISINEFTLPITPAEARNFIQKQTDDFGIFIDTERVSELIAYYNRSTYKAIVYVRNNLGLDINATNPKAVISELRKLGVDTSFFVSGKSNSPSLNEKVRTDILSSPNVSQLAKDLVSIYSTISKNSYRVSALASSYLNLPMSAVPSVDNKCMGIVHPIWTVLNTSRIQASEPNIQGISRDYPEIITAPKGYVLVRADSGQIEPRINFSTVLRDDVIMNLIMEYDDAYYGILHYCLLTDEQLSAYYENFQQAFQKIDVKAFEDARQNIKRLTNAGSYGSKNLDGININLADAYQRRIVKHPKRIALENKIKQQIAQGDTIFSGAFGTPVIPDATSKYTPDSAGWEGHVMRCGLNNPIQTTASELMMFSVNKAKEIISRAKDTHICFYKHDEACFYVSEADMAAGIGDELKEVTAYNVKGWLPIKSDPYVGTKWGNIPTFREYAKSTE